MATGVLARAAPATRAAPAENRRRTIRYRTATAATPISACGTRTDHEFSPNTRTEMPITQRNAGGLSTVIAFAASEEP